MITFNNYINNVVNPQKHGASANALMPISCNVKGAIRETPLHIAIRTRNEKMTFLMLGREDYINFPEDNKALANDLSVTDSVSHKYHKPSTYGLSERFTIPPHKYLSNDRPTLSKNKNVFGSESIESLNSSRKHRADIKIKDGKGRTAVHLAALSLSPRLLSTILKYEESKILAFERDLKNNTPVHALFTRSDSTVQDHNLLECLRLLINYGLDLNKVNYKGQTALYLAVRNKKDKAVELLINNGADASIDAADGTSLVHVACKVDSSKCLEHVFNSGKVYGKIFQEIGDDGVKKVPFHIATCTYGVECIKVLLKNGDHLAHEDNKGKTRCDHLLKNIPTACLVLEDIFDEKITSSGNRSYEANYSLTYDYSVLFLSDSRDDQNSIVPSFTEKRFQKLLSHPLIATFLFVKWNRIKPFFYTNVLFYAIFLGLHTYYVVRTFGPGSRDWSDELDKLNIFRCFHTIMFILILIPDVTVMFAKSFRQWETITKVITFSTSAYIVFSPQVESQGGEMLTENGSVLPDVAAISIFFAWAEMMMLFGRFPVFGIYILMFTRVSYAILKFLVAFSSLLIGFSISFSIIFKGFKDDESFSTFHGSFVKTLMMMIGEIDYGTLLANSNGSISVSGNIAIVTFLFLVPIIVANLLIGLAVSDIPDLNHQGTVRRLSKQALYLESFEGILKCLQKMPCFPRAVKNFLRKKTRIRPQLTITPNKRYLQGRSNFIKYLTAPPFPEKLIYASADVIVKTAEKNPRDFQDMDDDLDKNISFKDRFSNIPYVQSVQCTNSTGRFTSSQIPNGMPFVNGMQPDQLNLIIENSLHLMQKNLSKDVDDLKKFVRHYVMHIDHLMDQLIGHKTNTEFPNIDITCSSCSIQHGTKSSEIGDEVAVLETQSLSDAAEFGDSSKKNTHCSVKEINDQNKPMSAMPHNDSLFKILTDINTRLVKQETLINEFVSNNPNK